MRNLFGEKISVIAIIEKVSRLKQRHTNGPFEMAKWTISSQIDSQCIKFWSFSKVTHWTCHDAWFPRSIFHHFPLWVWITLLYKILLSLDLIILLNRKKDKKKWIQEQLKSQIQFFLRKAKPKRTLISGRPKVMP